MIEFDQNEWQINVKGSNQPQNYFIPIILLLGGLKAFESIGFSPNLFSENNTKATLYSTTTHLLIFGPQSFSLIGYGSAALVLGGFLLFSTFSNLGAGSIKFEKASLLNQKGTSKALLYIFFICSLYIYNIYYFSDHTHQIIFIHKIIIFS